MFRKILKLICRFLAVIPLPIMRTLVLVLGYGFYFLTPFRKKVIVVQIQKTLGRKLSDKEIRKLVLGNYIHYACVLFESLILYGIDLAKSDYIQTHFSAPNKLLLEKALARQKGVILIGSHVGFWEAIGAYCVRNIAPVTVAVKLMKSGFAQSLREGMQEHPDMHLVDSRMGRQRIIAMLNALRRKEIVGIFLDQYRAGEDFVKFLGQDARTNSTAAVLWRKTGAAVILIHVIRKRFGEYEIDIREADPPDMTTVSNEREQVRLINTYFNKRIEEVVIEHPEQWFWAHRRFKENPEFRY